MKIVRYFFLAWLSLVSLASAAPYEQPVEPYPLEYFALRDVVNNVQISPNGKRLALLRIPTKDGNPILEVYDASDLSAEPFRLNADPMEITTYNWASDTNIVFFARQQVRDKIEGFNQGVYDTRFAKVDVETRKIETFDELNGTVSHLLPNEPEKIIVSFNPGSEKDSKIAEAFRPRAYYVYDLKRGSRSLLIRGKVDVAQIEFDEDGNPFTARGFDLATGEFIWYYRRPGETAWREAYRQDENSFETFEIEGKDKDKPGNFLVIANNDNDKAGLWSFNPETQEFEEQVYQRSDVDVAGVRFHSNDWTESDTVVGVAYIKDKIHVEYFDELEGATIEQLENILPYSHDVRITSRSRDGQTLAIYNSGPHDPGTYYLIKDGELKTIGSKQPLLESAKLADVRYINYEARDGRQIAGYITVPHGKPPFPTVVLPHGGPFVSEVVGYDEWGQLLANNGYLVLQPQYRGSLGYGMDHFLSSFIDGSEAGYAMQDDKDDGALYLVEQGLADRDRLAMFGWSYGGYAALVAASRTPQIYQCVVAGAAVADMGMQFNYYRDELRGAQLISQLSYRTGAVNPIEEVAKVNVPMLLIHGDVDQRVPPEHLRKYLKALGDYDKEYRHVWLEGADHFYNTLFFNHQITLYENLVGFLGEECGPGGL